MASRHILSAIIFALPVDLVFELFYQMYVKYHCNDILAGYEKANTFIEDLSKNLNDSNCKEYDYKQLLPKTINHVMHHLAGHLFLCFNSFLFVMFIASKKICDSLAVKFKSFSLLFIKDFMGLSSMEMFLLQLEHCIVVYLESPNFIKQCISHKFYHAHESVINVIWVILIIFAVVPILVRCKVYCEVRLHYEAPLVAAAVFTIFLFFYKLFLFNVDLRILRNLEDINITKFNVLNDYIGGKGYNINIYNDKEKHYDTSQLVLDFVFSKNIILYGDISKYSFKEKEAALLHCSFDFSFWGQLSEVFIPLVQRFLFAFICIYFSKYHLKRFCNDHIGHITAFLILEEMLDTNVQKFIFAPFNILELFIEGGANSLVKKHGLGNDYAKYLLISELHAHSAHIHPSFFYDLFNKNNKLLTRINNLID